LAAGYWEKARDLFDRYTLIYPLDEQSPKALYRSARLSFLRGDVTACIRRLDRMKTEYPVPEYWDRIWRLSADVAFSKGRLNEGLEALDMILGLDDLADLESVALKKAMVLTEEFEQSGESIPALEAWSELIETWPDSDSVEEYRNQRDSIGQNTAE
jgi:tetratricopeptide (TPR) repeat protein